jgi:hypothetical protein
MTRRRRVQIAGAIALYLGGFLVASTVGSLGYFHFGSPDRTCASCHEMAGAHATWADSAHRTLHCRDCHGGTLTLDLHALQAHANRAIRHFTRLPDDPIRLKETDVLRVNAACQKCHPQAFADWQSGGHSATYASVLLVTARAHPGRLAPDCLRCHGMFFDGNIEDLVAAGSPSNPWSPLDPVHAVQPAMPCLACHQVHTMADAAKPPHLYSRHEHAYFSASLLPDPHIMQGDRLVPVSSDPRQRLCVQCHAPTASRQLGSGDDRTPAGVHAGLSCMDCHARHSNSTRGSCAACHPGSSHCGIAVEQMDTTFRFPLSRHNIHTVACGDCHDGQRPVRH